MYEIKPANPEQIPAIYTLACDIWPSAYGNILPPGQIEYMLEYFYSSAALTDQMMNRGHKFIIIYQNNTPVGFASYGKKDISPNDSSNQSGIIYRLHKLYVLPTQQGKGTGRMMIDFILHDLNKSDAAILELNVNRHNKAIHFYKKLGFNITREEDIDIGNGFWMNDYVMEKSVGLKD